MARWFSVALRQLNRKGRHSATGLMACKKGQHGFEPMLSFLLQKYLRHIKASQPALIGHILHQILSVFLRRENTQATL